MIHQPIGIEVKVIIAAGLDGAVDPDPRSSHPVFAEGRGVRKGASS